MTLDDKQTINLDHKSTSLRIVWRSLTAEANGLPAVSIVVTAVIVVIVMLLWWSGPLHYTL